MARPKKVIEAEQHDTLQEQPETQPESETQQPLVKVRPVHGPMHHLILDKPIVGVTLFEEMDNWLEVQIAAGKLEIV